MPGEACCVESCRAKRKKEGPSLHKFPNDPELLEKWKEAIGNSRYSARPLICSKHFEKEFIQPLVLGGATLKPGAIPTLLLKGIKKEEETETVQPHAPDSHPPQVEAVGNTERPKRKRKFYSSDYTEEDMIDPELARSFYRTVRSEIKLLLRAKEKQRSMNRRLKKKVEDLEELLGDANLKENFLVDSDQDL